MEDKQPFSENTFRGYDLMEVLLEVSSEAILIVGNAGKVCLATPEFEWLFRSRPGIDEHLQDLSPDQGTGFGKKDEE